MINSMVESGLQKFFISMADFILTSELQRTLKQDHVVADDDVIDLVALKFKQLKRPIMVILCLLGAATLLLIAEIIVFKWNNWEIYSS